jgi:Fe2+ or Zn2+ uptake regulation protein
VELESEKIAQIEHEIVHKLGFSVADQSLQITGSCDALRRHGACKHKH